MAFSGVIPVIPFTASGIVGQGQGLDKVVNMTISPAASQQFGVDTTGLGVSSILRNSASPNFSNVVSQFSSGYEGAAARALSPSQSSAPSQSVASPLGTSSQLSSQSSLYWPGAGDEPEAFFGGSHYNPGANGRDVVFSIREAASEAKTSLTSQIRDGSGSGVVGSSVGTNTLLPSSSGLFSASKNVGQYTETLTSVTQPSPAGGGSIGASIGGFTGFANKTVTNKTALAFNLKETLAGTSPITTGSPNFFKAASVTPSLITQAYQGKFDFSSPAPTPKKTSTWNFICSPRGVSWETTSTAERIAIFGTNQPPVLFGSKSMRELTLSEALVEGFVRGRTVEDKIAQLEDLMSLTLDSSGSYVKVPVYFVTANSKLYGDGIGSKDGGYFIIKGIKVKEELRDHAGKTTRAIVDVSLVQVPPYQVDNGRDIANSSVSGSKSYLTTREVPKDTGRQANQSTSSSTSASAGSGTRTKSNPPSASAGASKPGGGAGGAGPSSAPDKNAIRATLDRIPLQTPRPQ